MNNICKGKLKGEYGKNRPGDAVSLVSDTSKLMKTIKWKPSFNDLEIILKTAIKWEEKLKYEKPEVLQAPYFRDVDEQKKNPKKITWEKKFDFCSL